jgi:hypothetical protein
LIHRRLVSQEKTWCTQRQASRTSQSFVNGVNPTVLQSLCARECGRCVPPKAIAITKPAAEMIQPVLLSPKVIAEWSS